MFLILMSNIIAATVLWEVSRRLMACKVFVKLCRSPLNVVNVSLDAVLNAAFTGMLRHHRPACKHIILSCETLC